MSASARARSTAVQFVAVFAPDSRERMEEAVDIIERAARAPLT